MSLVARGQRALAAGSTSERTASLLNAGALSFEAAVLEALSRGGARAPGEAAAVEPAAVQPSPAPAEAPWNEAPATHREAAVIAREAERARLDPALLVALRRTENGGPGREFGVVSVAAEGLEAQARVAATTVRNSLAHFERQGGVAIDPTTTRYTDDFLRFLSARYAPIGAANDPRGLNRHHAANLIALYRKASGGAG
mgnify:CR=1 FL=1